MGENNGEVAESISNLDKVLGRFFDWGIGAAPKLLGAVVTIAIGFWLSKMLMKMLNKALIKSQIDISLHSFLNSISEFLLKVVVVITAANILGIPTTTFIAAFSAAGLAIGLALKDSLANFAGGVIILTFKIFSVGDYIEADGYEGEVREIKLLFTKMNTFDNTVITIPNGDLATGKIKNYSAEPDRRLDLVFGIGYEDDIDKAKRVMSSVISSHSLIRDNPEPLIQVSELGDNSVDLVLKAWCSVDDYWTIYFDLKEDIKKAFDRESITIPYPQRDVHFYGENQNVAEPIDINRRA